MASIDDVLEQPRFGWRTRKLSCHYSADAGWNQTAEDWGSYARAGAGGRHPRRQMAGRIATALALPARR